MIVERSFQQGSPEWMAARCGSPGASSLDKIITSTGKTSTQRKQYLYKMAGEKLLGKKEESFSSPAMARGTELEAEARAVFEMISGLSVEEVAMCYPDESKRFHCSPDGLIIGKDEGLEIKCPLLSTHVGYLDRGVLPTKYKLQTQGSLAITGYSKWWFCSYYPGLTPLILVVDRDETMIKAILDALNKFCDDMDILVEKLS